MLYLVVKVRRTLYLVVKVRQRKVWFYAAAGRSGVNTGNEEMKRVGVTAAVPGILDIDYRVECGADSSLAAFDIPTTN